MTTPDNLTPMPDQIISDVMRDVDAYAFDYQAYQKLAPSRVEVERAIRRAYDAGRAAGAQVADVVARVSKDADGAVWLHVTAPSGKQAAFCLDALVVQRGGIVGSTLLEWADAIGAGTNAPVTILASAPAAAAQPAAMLPDMIPVSSDVPMPTLYSPAATAAQPDLAAVAKEMREALGAWLASDRADCYAIVGRDEHGHSVNATGLARIKARAALARYDALPATARTEPVAQDADLDAWIARLAELADAFYDAGRTHPARERARAALLQHARTVGPHWRAREFIAERPEPVALTDAQMHAAVAALPAGVPTLHEWRVIERAVWQANGIGGE